MNRSFFRRVWSELIRPYWVSEDRWVALSLLGGHVALMGLFIYISVRLNYWSNDFFTALQELNSKAFFHLLGLFTIIAFFSILIFTIKHYLLQLLEMRWRKWMTNHLVESWTHNRSYYTLQLKGDGTDNPDQRIAEDIHQFINTSLSLSLGLLQQTITLFSFLSILWSLSGTLSIPLGGLTLHIPGYLCWGALLYAAIGSCISIYLGRPLIRLNYEHERREANFRYSLIRFRENMEGVAFYQGEAQEKQIFKTRFGHIVENFYAIVRRMLVINSWNSFYGQVQYLFPYLLATPRLFAKEITFGTFMQMASAFREVSGSLSFIVNNFVGIAGWRATTNRLLEFKQNLETPSPSLLTHEIHGEEDIYLTCEEISLPHGAILNKDLHLSFKKGEHTLITGPTGVGKSTLVRLISGLWCYGKGKVKVPAASFLFLPQKPYMPLGSLETIVGYPSAGIPQEEIEMALEAVGLGALRERLEEVNDWARVLSLGEQQRLSIARVLLNKPQWVFLDEATSAMDEVAEASLYRLVKTYLPQTTLISIGHRLSLKALHMREIHLGSPDSSLEAIVA